MQNAVMQMGQPQRMQVEEPHHIHTIGPMEERHKASAIYQQETTVLRLQTVKDVLQQRVPPSTIQTDRQ